MSNLLQAFSFLENAPLFDFDSLTRAPWPVVFDFALFMAKDPPASASAHPSTPPVTLPVTPVQKTASVNAGGLFPLINELQLRKLSFLKSCLNKLLEANLPFKVLSIKGSILDCNPYDANFLSDIRPFSLKLFELDNQYGIFDGLRAIMDPIAADLENRALLYQYTFFFVSFSPNSYFEVLTRFLERNYSATMKKYINISLPIRYSSFHPSSYAPLTSNHVFFHELTPGFSLEGFERVTAYIAAVNEKTHGLGAKLLLLEPPESKTLNQLYPEYYQYSQLTEFVVCVLIAVAPGTVAADGMALIRTTDLWCGIHGELVSLLSSCFSELVVTKPLFSRVLSSDRWIVCKRRNTRSVEIDYDACVALLKQLIEVDFPKTYDDEFTYFSSMFAAHAPVIGRTLGTNRSNYLRPEPNSESKVSTIKLPEGFGAGAIQLGAMLPAGNGGPRRSGSPSASSAPRTYLRDRTVFDYLFDVNSELAEIQSRFLSQALLRFSCFYIDFSDHVFDTLRLASDTDPIRAVNDYLFAVVPSCNGSRMVLDTAGLKDLALARIVADVARQESSASESRVQAALTDASASDAIEARVQVLSEQLRNGMPLLLPLGQEGSSAEEAPSCGQTILYYVEWLKAQRASVFPKNDYREIMRWRYQERLLGFPVTQHMDFIIGHADDRRNASVKWTEAKIIKRGLAKTAVRAAPEAEAADDASPKGDEVIALGADDPPEKKPKRQGREGRRPKNDLLRLRRQFD